MNLKLRATKHKFHKVYNLMYPDHPVSKQDFEPSMLVQKLIQLNRDLNIINRKSMADYGATEETIDKIISSQPFMETLYSYPRTTTKAQMKDMLMRVMNGEFL